ncbi:carbohydrate ABC transporter permease [Streptomyces scopuliridis]|uniref:carbohydrate ABC transporter permease n=1 Tax=Streptomyces scopuliridis TaxID=452529 RepID=UPI0036C3F6C5
MTQGRERLIGHAIMLVLAACATLPTLALLLLAFTPSDAGGAGVSLPHQLTLDNFRSAWNAGTGMAGYLAISASITAIVVAATVILSTLAGYALGTMRFPGSRIISTTFLFGVIMPVEGTIIPIFYDLRSVHLDGTVWAVILAQTALMVGFGTFWMRAAFRSMPSALIDAARMDGASHIRVLRTILLPLARPSLLALVALVLTWTWNEFLLALVLLASTTADLRTAPLALGLFQSQESVDINGLAAAAVVVAIVPIAAFLALQRHFVQGLTTGATVE